MKYIDKSCRFLGCFARVGSVGSNAGFDNDFQVETRFLTFTYPVADLGVLTVDVCL